MLASPIISGLCRPLASPLVGQTGIDLPSLDIQFAADRAFTVNADASANILARRGPPVNFKRLSGATQVNASGLIEWAPENLAYICGGSNHAGPIYFTKTTSSLIDPEGGTSAQFTCLDGALSQPRIQPVIIAPSVDTPAIECVWVKLIEGQPKPAYFHLVRGDSSRAAFNTDTWAVTNMNGAVGSVEDGGNGWKKLICRHPGGVSSLFKIGANNSNSYGDTLTLGTAFILGSCMVSRQVSSTKTYQTFGSAFYGPRFDYDPVTLQSKGLLIERSSTNLLINTLAPTPDFLQTLTVAAVVHTISFYGTGYLTLRGAHVADVYGDGPYPSRKTYTFTPTAGALEITFTGIVQFAQLEASLEATSYIPTMDATLARSAEVCKLQGAEFLSMFRQNDFTMYLQLFTNGWLDSPKTYASLYNTSDSASARSIRYIAQADRFSHRSGTTTGDIVIATTMQPVTKIAIAEKGSADRAGSRNGNIATATLSTGVNKDAENLYLGNNQYLGEYANSHFVEAKLYRKRLPNAKLQQLTTL